MNAIQLLKQDHRKVDALFKRYEKAGESAHQLKRSLARQIIHELAVHAAIEEQLFYPAARVVAPELEDQVLEALEEHHVAKWTLDELQKMSPEDERFDAKMKVLTENIRHHIDEEERELFPQLTRHLGPHELAELGRMLAVAKKAAPTHPHPMAPDTPPGNVLVAPLAKLLDSARDAAQAMAQRARRAVGGRGGKGRGRQAGVVSKARGAVRRATRAVATKASAARRVMRKKLHV